MFTDIALSELSHGSSVYCSLKNVGHHVGLALHWSLKSNQDLYLLCDIKLEGVLYSVIYAEARKKDPGHP